MKYFWCCFLYFTVLLTFHFTCFHTKQWTMLWINQIKVQGCQCDLKFWLFFNALGLFENQKAGVRLFLKIKKSQTKPSCFSVGKGLALTKHCLSCIIIINFFWQESMTMQGAKNIAKIVLLPWKCSMYLIRNKCTAVQLRGKKMLLKIGIVLNRCFWWVLMSVLCLFMHILRIICLKNTIWLFLTFLG